MVYLAKMVIHSSSVGAALRRARLDLGMGQGALADVLGISISCLNRVEHNKRGFDTEWTALLPEPLSSAVKEALARDVEGISDGRPRRLLRRVS